MRMAIVGSGISGLGLAHLLDPIHDVEVFEADSRIGGHTHTVEVEEDGRRIPVDMGFIVYNERTYPNLVKLFANLKVATQASNMSFALRDDALDFEWGTLRWTSLFAQRRNLIRPTFWRMFADMIAFNNRTCALLDCGALDDPRLSLGEFLANEGYSREFIDFYLIPMGASVWSTDAQRMLDFPMLALARFFKNHGWFDIRNRPVWRTVVGGSRSYVEAILKGLRGKVHSSSPVLGLRRLRKDGGELAGVELQIGGASARKEVFDGVILACHSGQALKILGSEATQKERELLTAFPYQRNEAILHTDTNLLPRRQKAWSAWNYRSPSHPRAPVGVTYNMNILQSLPARQTYCVSLNSRPRSTLEKSYRSSTPSIRSSRWRATPRSSAKKKSAAVTRSGTAGPIGAMAFMKMA